MSGENNTSVSSGLSNSQADSITYMPGPLKLSLFCMLREEFKSELPVVRLTKAALIEISHTLEGTVLNNRLPGLLFTGFQENRYWVKEVARYRQLADIAHSVCLFEGNSFFPSDASDFLEDEKSEFTIVKVKLALKDFLRHEWFLLVLTRQFSVLLCGLDRLESVHNESERTFDTFLTFEPRIINRTLGLLLEVLAHYRPDKLAQIQEGCASFPPTDPRPEYLTDLTTQFLTQISFYHNMMRQLDQEQAMHATINRMLHEASQPTTILLNLLEMIEPNQELFPEDLEMLKEASFQLKKILQDLRNVTQFKTQQLNNIEFLDTGKPIC